jgi:molybdopterin biosynthesis enzyme
MMGLREVLPAVFRARTTGEIDKARGFVKLVPGLLKRAGSRQASGADAGAEAVSDGGPHGGPDAGPDAEAHVAVDVEPLGSRGRGDVIALARADCLVYLGPDRGSVAAREIVDVFML